MALPTNAKTWTTRHDERAEWGDGPWQSEPDKISWTDAGTGRPCLIVRNPMGALCGYVGVDPGHPLHGASYDGYEGGTAMHAWEQKHGDIDVHGGLTYAEGCAHGEDEATGICHVPEPGASDDVWWFGFDCCHLYDLAPRMRKYSTPSPNDVYRTVGYVVAQVESLARQLVQA